MKTFFPKTGSELEWSNACSRVEEYLRALRAGNEEQREQIILRVLERAADKHAENPGLCPTTLAMDEIRADMDRWFKQNLSPDEQAAVPGLISLLAFNALEKWPAVFLAEDIPADFQRRLRESQVRAAPDLKVSSMVPQPFVHPLRAAIQLPVVLGKLAADDEGGGFRAVPLFNSVRRPAAVTYVHKQLYR